jgi:hypothetical protein
MTEAVDTTNRDGFLDRTRTEIAHTKAHIREMWAFVILLMPVAAFPAVHVEGVRIRRIRRNLVRMPPWFPNRKSRNQNSKKPEFTRELQWIDDANDSWTNYK